MMTTDTDQTPRVWIGCLHCYNGARLVGDWFPAAGADLVTVEQVHRDSRSPLWGCEELWVMDHEYLPIKGECSPMEAAAWAERLGEVEEHLRDAFRAWVAAGGFSADSDGLPDPDEFTDVFCGTWLSFRAYAEDLADSTGMMADWPETARSYFNWDSWTRDQRHDYTVVDADGGEVHVFRSL